MKIRLGLLSLLLPAALAGQTAPIVQFQTNLGNINVTLFSTKTPKTVANFLTYVNSGAYTSSIIHRSVPGFVVQGGGYTLGSNVTITAIAQNAVVPNEPGISNTAGTIAMAKLSGEVDSATNQWFFNTVDNASHLDDSDGGFTVFGQVADSASMAVLTAIAAVPNYDFTSQSVAALIDFANLPLQNPYTYPNTPANSNFVVVNAIVLQNASAAPAISSGGIISASDFGAYKSAAPASFIEIYGSDLAGSTRPWAASDFSKGNAPTSLDGVSVAVDGQAAYVSYISPTQIDVQLPQTIPVGGQVPVVVTYNGLSSAQAMLTMQALNPGLDAPPTFLVNGTQYVVATHLDYTLVGNGSIPGIATTPAAPGETVVFYGTGFGGITQQNIPYSGFIIPGQTNLTNSVQFSFQGEQGNVLYQGLAPGYVGLYQFNVTIPADAPNGDLSLVVTQNGVTMPQTLSISVHN